MNDASRTPPVATLLRTYRRATGLTQEQLAERAGISTRSVSDLERDTRRVPRRETIDLLAAALALGRDECALLAQAVTQTRARALAPPAAAAAPARAPRVVNPYRHTMPSPPTAFIGRHREIAALRDRLTDAATHLLTLIGTGGTGKTRLALQTAATLEDHFAAGVAFVDLAAVGDPRLVLATVGQVLGLTDLPRQTPVHTLASFLRGKRVLLILDTFEHLLPAVQDLQDLVTATPSLTVLVTSRAALRIRGERLHPVRPLAVPRAPLPPLDALMQVEALQLFLARAREVLPDFALSEATAPAVAAICARLDGLPLAIELVAARVQLLAPEALLTRLDQRLRVATGGARDLPARQQTLRASLDWSYNLLDPVAQRLFARLAVFPGGPTLEAIEAVCDPDGSLGGAVLDGVQALLDTSLLQREEGPEGEPRLVLLDTIHDYARERLAASGDHALVAAAHARYFLPRALRATAASRGPHEAARRRAEEGDPRAALAYGLHQGQDGTGALHVVLSLSHCRDLWDEHRAGTGDWPAGALPADAWARGIILELLRASAATQGAVQQAGGLVELRLRLALPSDASASSAGARDLMAWPAAHDGTLPRVVWLVGAAAVLLRQDWDEPGAIQCSYRPE